MDKIYLAELNKMKEFISKFSSKSDGITPDETIQRIKKEIDKIFRYDYEKMTKND